MGTMRARWFLSVAFLLACSPSPAPVEPGADSGTDTSTDSSADAAVLPDGAASDGGTLDDILGTFGQGSTCPLVSADLPLATPSLREDGLVFVASEKYERTAGGRPRTARAGQRVRRAPTSKKARSIASITAR